MPVFADRRDIANLAYWVTGTEGSNPSLSATQSLSPETLRVLRRKSPYFGPICISHGTRDRRVRVTSDGFRRFISVWNFAGAVRKGPRGDPRPRPTI